MISITFSEYLDLFFEIEYVLFLLSRSIRRTAPINIYHRCHITPEVVHAKQITPT